MNIPHRIKRPQTLAGGVALLAMIWMSMPILHGSADPDIFDGDLVSPDPIIKYGLKKVLENIKISLPGIPKMGGKGSSGSSQGSGSSSSMGSSKGSSMGSPMGSSGGSSASLGKGSQTGIGMQSGQDMGLGKGKDKGDGKGKGEGEGKEEGKGEGSGSGKSGSEGDMIAQGKGVGSEMDNPSEIEGANQGQGQGQGQNGSEGEGTAQGNGESGEQGSSSSDAKGSAKGGSQGIKGSHRGANITIGDTSEMIEMAEAQEGDAEAGKVVDSQVDGTSRGPAMSGKNRGRSVGVEQGESVPSDL